MHPVAHPVNVLIPFCFVNTFTHLFLIQMPKEILCRLGRKPATHLLETFCDEGSIGIDNCHKPIESNIPYGNKWQKESVLKRHSSSVAFSVSLRVAPNVIGIQNGTIGQVANSSSMGYGSKESKFWYQRRANWKSLSLPKVILFLLLSIYIYIIVVIPSIQVLS